MEYITVDHLILSGLCTSGTNTMLSINNSNQTFDRLNLLAVIMIMGEIVITPIRNKFRLSVPSATEGDIAIEVIIITRYMVDKL